MQPISPSFIRADNAVTIELHPNRWKLVRQEELTGGRTVFEAGQTGETTYPPDFAQYHRLPTDGIPTEALRQVLLGWSPRLASWQLGLLFTDTFASTRNSRWLELARWHDPDGSLHSLTANRAGSALARVMHLPFKVIPPQFDDATPAVQPKPLPALPLDIGDWLVNQAGDGLVLERQRMWANTRIKRIAWYTFWVFAYVAVSVLSLTVKLGLPNAGTLLPMPHLLPYMGLAVAVVLVYLLGKNIYELATTPNRVQISRLSHELTAFRGDSPMSVAAGRKVAGVYVSEVAHQRRSKRAFQHIEINLLNVDGEFTHVLACDSEHEIQVDEPLRQGGGVMPLSPNDVQTPAQAAALYIAQALGDVPAYHDQRYS